MPALAMMNLTTSRTFSQVRETLMAVFAPAAKTQPRAEETAPALDPAHSQLINQILELSPSASPEFLSSFAGIELKTYLKHLTYASMPRGANSTHSAELAAWVRDDNTPGIVHRTTSI